MFNDCDNSMYATAPVGRVSRRQIIGKMTWFTATTLEMARSRATSVTPRVHATRNEGAALLPRATHTD